MLRGDSAHMWQFNLLFSYYLTFKLRSTTLIQPTSPSLLMSETLSIGKLFEVWCVCGKGIYCYKLILVQMG